MRPTPHQVYCNPELFISLLEQQGVSNARPKVIALFKRMIEHQSVKNWADKIDRDLRNSEQQPFRYPLSPRSNRDPKRVEKQRRKRMSPLRTNHIRYRQYLNRTMAAMERKIAAWPELDFSQIKLRKKPDGELIKHHVTRRHARGRVRISG